MIASRPHRAESVLRPPAASIRAPARHAVALVLAAAFALPTATLAHGELHDRIAAVERRIAREPSNPEHYLLRADLYRQHGDWPSALADLDRAAGLAPENAGALYLRGRVLLDAGRPADARAALESYLTRESEHRDRRASAHLLLAEAAMGLAQPLQAAGHYRRATELAERPGPQAFLDCARALGAAGEPIDDALACLDDGLARLGTLPALELPAIELELEAGRFDAALARLDRLAARSPRREHWRVRRGEILEQAGRFQEARAAFLEARAALAALPADRRPRAGRELEARIRRGLARLDAPEPASTPQDSGATPRIHDR